MLPFYVAHVNRYQRHPWHADAAMEQPAAGTCVVEERLEKKRAVVWHSEYTINPDALSVLTQPNLE